MTFSPETISNQNKSNFLWIDGEYEITVEKLANSIDQVADVLIKEHWFEIANYKSKVKLEPRWQALLQLEQENRIILLVLRKNKCMIGYCMFVLNNHLHYANLLTATNDVLFVTATERKSKLGFCLITESERYLKTINVDKVTWHMKPHRSFAKLLHRIGGYLHEEEIYGKLLR